MYNIYLFIKSLLNSFSDIILLSEKKKTYYCSVYQ